MCFRPATASAPKECPDCGKIIPTIAGMPDPDTCPSCGAKLDSGTTPTSGPGAARPQAPGGAPAGAPKAPMAPKPPQ